MCVGIGRVESEDGISNGLGKRMGKSQGEDVGDERGEGGWIDRGD